MSSWIMCQSNCRRRCEKDAEGACWRLDAETPKRRLDTMASPPSTVTCPSATHSPDFNHWVEDVVEGSETPGL
eukprot:3676697-Rhodomonas_salina.2